MIKVSQLEKNFGKFEVIRGISFTVEPGKITAIVGPNGSGKTTIIKSILGLVRPQNGDITIDEKSIYGDFLYREKIGYMPQMASFPENLTVREVINMIYNLRNCNSDPDNKLIMKLGLDSELGKQIKNLSGGNKQKVSALIALMFDPPILILDEPTAGLDPVTSRKLKDIIVREKENGKTIILTSHIMSEIEELADNIIFLLDGKISFNGSILSLLTYKGESKLEKAIANMMSEATKWN